MIWVRMMRAYCKKDEIDRWLDGRPVKYLFDKMNAIGIDISHKNLLQLLNNKNNWLLIYAIGVTKVLNKKIDDLFYIE